MHRILAAIFAVALCFGARADASIFGGDDSATATVVINVAEALGDTAPSYSMLWRMLTDEGEFAEYDDTTIMEAETNSPDSFLIRGLPGEFLTLRVRPGTYALDSVHGVVREGGVNYVAPGVVLGPERPVFEVREGEAIYLGIWEIALTEGQASARLWRLDQADLRAALARPRNRLRNVTVRHVTTREVACAPHSINWRTNRQIC